MSGVPGNGKYTELAWRGDLTPPITSYASSLRASAPHRGLNVPASTNTTRSAVVDRKPMRKGIRYFYAYGATDMPAPSVPTPGAGGVASSRFQEVLNHLFNWNVYVGHKMAGYPRNLGLSFRVPQLRTQATGAPGPGRMEQKPVFPRVQTVQRATAITRRYATRSARG